MIVLLFHYKFATAILSSFEFGLNLVTSTKSHITPMSSSLRKKSKIAAVIVQVVIDKLVYVHIEQLQFGFWDINAIVMIIWRINHPVHIGNILMTAK